MSLDLQARRAGQRRHPAFRLHGYMLRTETLAAVKGVISDWVELGKSGMSFAGLSRAGKTYVLLCIAKELPELFPNVAFIYLTAEVQSTADHLNQMFCAFLGQMHLELRPRAQTQACSLLANLLLSRCRDRGASDCVILLDEAQKLSTRHWQGMGIVWNRLHIEGVRTMVFPVGNDELHKRADMSTESGYAGVVGRFFVQKMDFDGVRSKEELKAVLAQYDQIFYPTADMPFSRYFALEAYDSLSWRLEYEVDAMWAALTAYSGVAEKELGLTRGYSVEWITDPVHFIFMEMLNNDKCQPGAGKGLPWLTAIERTCPARIC